MRPRVPGSPSPGARSGRFFGSSRVAVQNTAAMRADVDAPEDPRIAGDLEDQPPLMLAVVDAHPRASSIDGAKDPRLAVHGSRQIERSIRMLWRGFAEAEGLNLLDIANPGER